MKLLSRLALYFSALAGLAAFLFDDRSAFGRGVRRVCYVWIAFGFLYSLPGLRRTFGWQAEFRKTAWLLAAVLAFLWIVRWLVRRLPEVEDWADPAESYALVLAAGLTWRAVRMRLKARGARTVRFRWCGC